MHLLIGIENTTDRMIQRGVMKKILILANHDMGLYNFRFELIQHLIQQGFEVHFSVPVGSKVPLLEGLSAIYHPTEMNRRGKNLFQDISLFTFYLKLIRSLKPVVILSYTAKPNIYGGIASSVLGVPQLANITGLGSELQGNGKSANLLRYLYRIGLRKTRAVFFQNSSNMKYFMEHGLLNAKPLTKNTQRPVTLPGSGVNTDRFKPLEGKVFSDTGSARFLFISRIMQDKGIEEFIAAAKSVKVQYPACQFDILGFYESDTYRKEIESLQKQGVIHSVMLSEDTRIQMADADCVVLPSYHEGMSNVLLEAASSGLSVIATDIPGCREAVLDGVSGYLCVKKDAESLGQQMVRLISRSADEKCAMGLAGRKLMVEQFDRRVVIAAYMREIQEIVGAPHA